MKKKNTFRSLVKKKIQPTNEKKVFFFLVKFKKKVLHIYFKENTFLLIKNPMNADDYEIEELLQEQKQKEKAKKIYDTTPAHKEYVHKVNVGLSKRELAGSIMSRDKNRNKFILVSEKYMQYIQTCKNVWWCKKF